MTTLTLGILALVGVSFLISLIGTRAMIAIAPRVGFTDKPGGRKIHDNPKPLGGGVAITLALILPLLGAIAYLHLRPAPPIHVDRLATGSAWKAYGSTTMASADESLRNASIFDGVDHAALTRGARGQSTLALTLIAAILLLHLTGLLDDRRAMGPYSKLVIQLLAAAIVVVPFHTMRAMTFLDQHVGGPWLSILVTICWIAAITNAFNFLDNMDGLSAGVAAICTLAFLVTTVLIGQWFVAATLACLLGATLGFLVWNFPPARIFMGDSGSLVIGFVLGVLTVRTTFLAPGQDFGAGWYALFAPMIVLALPLYDLVVVSAIRISRGKSPFVGDKNHFSHRLVDRGMSRRTAVLCLYLVTAATSIAAIVLPHVHGKLVAGLIVFQTLLILGVVMLLEQHPVRSISSTEP